MSEFLAFLVGCVAGFVLKTFWPNEDKQGQGGFSDKYRNPPKSGPRTTGRAGQ